MDLHILELAQLYLVIEKMQVNIFINNDNTKNELIDFFTRFKKIEFNYCKIDSINKFKDANTLFLISKEDSEIDFKKYYEKNLKNHNSIFYLLPISFYRNFNDLLKNKCFYPINIDSLINSLIVFFNNKITLNQQIILSNDNLLINLHNNKNIYLTEIESRIIRFLHGKNFVNKDIINEKVLGIKKDIDSKSLDTHLYRLRNKLSSICNNIKILSNDSSDIKLNSVD